MKLDPQTIASLLTLIGVLITVIVGFRSTVRTITTELRKQRYNVLNVYAEGLFNNRLTAYKEIFFLLSNTVKMIDYPELFTQTVDIENIEKQLNAWDSNMACYLLKNLVLVQ